MSVTGEPDRPPVKAGLPLTDLGAGLFALSAILAAIHWRTSSGTRPAHRHVAARCGRRVVGVGGDRVFRGSGSAAPGIGASHECAVSGVSLRGWIHHGWRRQRSDVLKARDRCLVTRSGHATRGLRRCDHASSIASRWRRSIEAVTLRATCADWLRRLDDAGIPCGPINTYAEVFADPASRSHGSWRWRSSTPRLGRLRTLGTPIKMSATPLDPRRRAPLLGEHTEEVLRDAGYGRGGVAVLAIDRRNSLSLRYRDCPPMTGPVPR